MDSASYIGKRVMASDGDAGVVDDVLTDEDGTPRRLVVRDRGVFGPDLVLPFDHASIEGSAVRVAMTRAQVHAGERYDPNRHGESAGLFSAAAGNYDASDNPPNTA
ncbi:MAG: PRC-barrel domain-containing protein [Chloroflexota bacterium]